MDRRADLVNPEADTIEPQSPAPRLATLDSVRIGLVDSMLNPGAMWGQGILDAVEARLVAVSDTVSFQRIARSPVTPPSSSRWGRAISNDVAQCARRGCGGGRGSSRRAIRDGGPPRYGLRHGAGGGRAGASYRLGRRRLLRAVEGADRGAVPSPLRPAGQGAHHAIRVIEKGEAPAGRLALSHVLCAYSLRRAEARVVAALHVVGCPARDVGRDGQ